MIYSVNLACYNRAQRANRGAYVVTIQLQPTVAELLLYRRPAFIFFDHGYSLQPWSKNKYFFKKLCSSWDFVGLHLEKSIRNQRN